MLEIIVLLFLVWIIKWGQSKLYKKHGLKNLSYTCSFSTTEAAQGDEIELIEVVKNNKFLPIPWFKTELITSRWLQFADADSTVTHNTRFVPSFFLLKGHHQVTRRWKVTCLKRGIFGFNRVVGTMSDLFGENAISQGFPVEASITVLPLPLDFHQFLYSPRDLTGDIVVRRHLVEDPFSISGVREYTQRDSMNRINWMATARQQAMMVHNYDSTSQQAVTIVLNMQSSRYERGGSSRSSQIEIAIRVCATLFEESLEANIPFQFMSNTALGEDEPDVLTESHWGAQHVLDCQRLLSALPMRSTRFFSEFLEQEYSRIDSTDIVLVSIYLSEEILEFARQKQQDGIHVKIIIAAGLEANQFPDDCDVFCLYDEIDEREGAQADAV